jgi:hypothetical protein
VPASRSLRPTPSLGYRISSGNRRQHSLGHQLIAAARPF